MAEDKLADLTRGDLLRLANELTERALARKETDKHERRPARFGSPKDPVVRRLAAMMLYRMKEIEGMSYDDIGQLLGVTRERVFQLHKDLGAQNPHETLEEAGLL